MNHVTSEPLAIVADAVSATQWLIAIGSLSSALVALALAFGLKEWIFRPRVTLLLRHRSSPDEVSDRIVTKRIDTGDNAAFVRLRLDNRGRSTARNVGVRVLQVHGWDATRRDWIRARPELDGRLLQPSNQLPDEPDTVDIFPSSDRIVDPRLSQLRDRRRWPEPGLRRDRPPLAAQQGQRSRCWNVEARAARVRGQHRGAAVLRDRLIRRNLA